MRRVGTLLAVLASTAAAQGPLNHDRLTQELRTLAGSSNLATLTSIGRSQQGRDLWLMTIARPGGVPVETRPGLLVVANLEGDHTAGSSLTLESIRYMLSTDGQAALGDVLARNVIYVVPRLNPDGAEAGRRGNTRPFDDDHDGRVDEDPPEDLNGDGVITVMRKVDPGGAFLVDSANPRLMRRADRARGQAGTHTLYIEGRDTDGDGFYNEDGVGGVDLNRNFQHAYPYYEPDAGPWMVSEPESRALMDFMVGHRNVAAIFTFSLSDNVVTPPNDRGMLAAASMVSLPQFAAASNGDARGRGVFGGGGGFGGGFGGFGGGGQPSLRGAQPGRDNDPASGQRPSTTFHRNDRDYFVHVSNLYKEITGISRVAVNREAEGAFFQYGYFQFGVPSFSSPGWGFGRTTRDSMLDVTLLHAIDSLNPTGFVRWTPFTHPQLGAVEIGGFRPAAIVNPPADSLAALGRRHGVFLSRLAGLLPQVRVAGSEVTAHGGGVFTVSVTVENAGHFPTALQQGLTAGAVDATTVQIQVPQESIVTGAAKTHRINRMEGSGVREQVTWVIRGQQGAQVEIRVRAQKGGTSTTTVTLR